MTLEDFFTLTEMKDGLTATSRVEELVRVMQKEDCIVNHGDAIRQCAAVASIIATTNNKDCLDLFVQLGGLCFIGRWLKDAENFGSNSGDNFVEEPITALLLALEKLCIDKERSISSGIWVTVRHLLDHNNVKVQDRARAIFDNWNLGSSDAVHQQMENTAPVNDFPSVSGDMRREIGEAECSPTDVSSCGEKEQTESYASKAITVDKLPLQSPNVPVPERVEDVQTKHDEYKLRSKMELDTCDGSFDPLLSSAAMSGDGQEGATEDIKDVKMSSVEETTGVETCGPDVPQDGCFSKADTVPVNLFHEDKKPVDKLNSGQENLSGVGAAAAFDVANISDADALTSQDTGAIPSVGVTAVSDAEPQTEMAEVPKAVEDNDCGSDVAKNSPDKKVAANKPLSKEAGAAIKCKDTVRDGYKEVSNLSALYGGRKGKKHSKKARGKKSTIELEYGILDALDIARQVAKEVKREMTDYKETFCSTSSDRSSGGRIGQPMSPGSINDSPCTPDDTSSGEASTGQSQSAEGDGKSSKRSGNGDSDTNDPIEDEVDSSHMTDTKKDKTEKGLCGFDLNEEVCLDDGGDKTLLGEEFHHDSSSQRLKHLEIDLNMAEDGEDASNFHLTEKDIPVSSSLNSKISSVEANQGRSERLDLDLNSTGEDDDVVISHCHQINGRTCPSPASSSLQMRPHERNFDLNDRPYSSFNDPLSDRSLYQNSPSHGAISLRNPTTDPFISIMGTKVEVNRDDLVRQGSSYLQNGKATLEPSAGGNLSLGPAVSSLYSPLTRCSTSQTGHPISFSLAPYGPSDWTHCTVDPRVGTIMPGVPGPVPALYSPYPVPFTMSLNPGPSRLQMDLNSGLAVDGANHHPNFLMQLFPPSQAKSSGEHSSTFLQPFSGPVVGAKRKEPEGGWEPYPIGYGQHQSPWK